VRDRQRQLHLAKQTCGYKLISQIPQKERPRELREPTVYLPSSQRYWNAWYRSWRRSLHIYEQEHEEPDDSILWEGE